MAERVVAGVVWQELKRLVGTGATGTIYLASEDNTAGRVGIKAGKVVFLAYKFSAGRAALPQLQAIKSAEYRFESVSPGSLPNMPSTEEILSALLGGAEVAPPSRSLSPLPAASRTSAPPPRTASVPAMRAVASVPPPGGLKDEIGRLLADYMGPIAPIVFEEHWATGEKRGLDVSTIIEALAKELGGSRAGEFRAKALAKLR